MKQTRRTARRSRAAVQRRLLALAGLGALGYAALLARAVQLQALDGERLARRAAAQHRDTLQLDPLRGALRDRNGVLLAVSAEVESVAASPRRIGDRRHTVRGLARALGASEAEIRGRLRPQRSFAWIERWVTPEQAERVRALDLDGVHLYPERKRFYPSRRLAASYLGFAGRDGEGLAGIELAFDRALRGEAAAVPALRDGSGQRLIEPARADVAARAPAGADVVLTLDARLQHAAERALARALERTGAAHGTIVAIEPATGDVLALAEAPGFDPNRFWEARPDIHRTRAFVDPFEPGSTLKPFTIAVALDAGAVRPDEQFDCEGGSWRVRDRWIRDWRPHGVLSVRDIVRVSSNIGAAKAAARVPVRELVAGLQRFGFGARSRSGFPGESPGLVRDLRDAQEVERANLAFGQGIAVTAVQLATATAALANEGVLVPPRLALRIELPDGTVEVPPTRGQRVVSRATARTVLAMLRDVVRDGTGGGAALARHAVAGKTGTAQKVVDGRYSDTRFVASFLGIVPAEAPRLVVVVVLDEPRGAHTGGAVAAPVFREVAGFAMELAAGDET